MSQVRVAEGRQPIARGPSDRRALAVMTSAHGIQHLYVAGLAVSYPFVVAQFHVSYAVLGVVLTVAGVLGGVLQASAGLARRASTAVMLVGQNAGMAIASVLGAIAPGFGVFGVARVLGSAASWPQHPVGSAYLSRRFPHRRASVLSWHVAGGSAGTVVAPLFISALISTVGWRWALAALGAALGAGGLLVRLALPKDAAPATARPDGALRAPQPEPPPRSVPLRRLLRRRQVVAVLAASSIAAGGRGLGTLTTYIPAYLRSGLHLSTLSVGTLFTVIMAASIIGPVVAGGLADRMGRTRTLVATYLAGAGALLWFGFAGRDLAALAVLGVCIGVFAYAESPLLQSVFSDLTDRGAGPANAGSRAGAAGGTVTGSAASAADGADTGSAADGADPDGGADPKADPNGSHGQGGDARGGREGDGGHARSVFGIYFAIAYGLGALWNAIIGWIVTTSGFTVAFVTMAASFAVSALVLVAFAGDRQARRQH